MLGALPRRAFVKSRRFPSLRFVPGDFVRFLASSPRTRRSPTTVTDRRVPQGAEFSVASCARDAIEPVDDCRGFGTFARPSRPSRSLAERAFVTVAFAAESATCDAQSVSSDASLTAALALRSAYASSPPGRRTRTQPCLRLLHGGTFIGLGY